MQTTRRRFLVSQHTTIKRPVSHTGKRPVCRDEPNTRLATNGPAFVRSRTKTNGCRRTAAKGVRVRFVEQTAAKRSHKRVPFVDERLQTHAERRKAACGLQHTAVWFGPTAACRVYAHSIVMACRTHPPASAKRAAKATAPCREPLRRLARRTGTLRGVPLRTPPVRRATRVQVVSDGQGVNASHSHAAVSAGSSP